MNKTTKSWLIIAAVLVLLGGFLFVGVMETLGWDFTKLSTVKCETNTYEIGEDFNGIAMNTNTADITFVFSNDAKCKVVCYEEQNAKHSVAVKDGVLTVEVIDKRSVHDFTGLTFDTPKITVYLPKTQYSSLHVDSNTADVEIPKNFTFEKVDISLSTGDVDCCAAVTQTLEIKTSTGDVRVERISAGTLDISVSTGDVYLADIRCKNVISSGSTGDITLKNVIATEKFSIQRDTGDVKLESVDAGEIYIKTDTGDVRGTLLTDKIFLTQTDTGSVDVPNTTTGGKCEIHTDTGDIKISIANG